MKYLSVMALFWVNSVWAFPEMIRHGYAQCTACHVSPSGGGILTEYGRQLSSELMSTWGSPDEAQFLHSKLGKDLSDHGILVGGDIRAVDTHFDDSQQTFNKQFLMMGNIQGGYQSGIFTGVVSIGQITQPVDLGGLHGNFNATEYYGMLKFTDEIGIRAGLFTPAYGINIPDHTTAIKEMLNGLVPFWQFDSVEASYLSEHWTVLGTVGKTLAGVDPSIQENVGSLNVSYNLLNRIRVGASYWSGSGPQIDRRIYGANGIIGITEHFYNMTEIDIENWSQPNQQSGVYALSQLAYEVWKGVTPYIQYQHEHDNNADPTTLIKTYGVGCHFYPRPHFELSGEWDRVNQINDWSNQAYLLAHYYF